MVERRLSRSPDSRPRHHRLGRAHSGGDGGLGESERCASSRELADDGPAPGGSVDEPGELRVAGSPLANDLVKEVWHHWPPGDRTGVDEATIASTIYCCCYCRRERQSASRRSASAITSGGVFGVFGEPGQREQDETATSLRREEHAVDDAVAVGADLPDVGPELAAAVRPSSRTSRMAATTSAASSSLSDPMNSFTGRRPAAVR